MNYHAILKEKEQLRLFKLSKIIILTAIGYIIFNFNKQILTNFTRHYCTSLANTTCLLSFINIFLKFILQIFILCLNLKYC